VVLGKYQKEGLAALADRSHRPRFQPRQLNAGIEALICQLRGAHPRWGPRRLAYELNKANVSPMPSRSTICRVLVRRGLVPARKRKRRRQDCKRWQRDARMQLWELDVTGSVFLTDGTELKLFSGIDDHSRFCVIATVVPWATARAACRAFIAAMTAYGIPDEVLSDNGKQFTGRFGQPRPGRCCSSGSAAARASASCSSSPTRGVTETPAKFVALEVLEVQVMNQPVGQLLKTDPAVRIQVAAFPLAAQPAPRRLKHTAHLSDQRGALRVPVTSGIVHHKTSVRSLDPSHTMRRRPAGELRDRSL
jgi:Homeodomain-like domain/Integrase core domain